MYLPALCREWQGLNGNVYRSLLARLDRKSPNLLSHVGHSVRISSTNVNIQGCLESDVDFHTH